MNLETIHQSATPERQKSAPEWQAERDRAALEILKSRSSIVIQRSDDNREDGWHIVSINGDRVDVEKKIVRKRFFGGRQEDVLHKNVAAADLLAWNSYGESPTIISKAFKKEDAA